jgi:hypothetical protein
MNKNIINTSHFQEPTVSGEKFLALMEDTVLRHIPAGGFGFWVEESSRGLS